MSTIEQIRQTAAHLRAELASPDAPPPTLDEARALAEAAIVLVEENARLAAVAESARSLVAAADACDREAERHPSSRSSAPVVRLINVMARLRQALGGTAPTAERKPVAGWVNSPAHPCDWYLTTEVGDRAKITVSAFGDDRGEGAENRFFRIECDDETTDGSVAVVNDRYGHEADEALLFSAEDALFAIADAINALRPGAVEGEVVTLRALVAELQKTNEIVSADRDQCVARVADLDALTSLKARVTDEKALSLIARSTVEAYLGATPPWKELQPTKRFCVWQHAVTGECCAIPREQAFGDYGRRMLECLEAIAMAEERSQLGVLVDLWSYGDK